MQDKTAAHFFPLRGSGYTHSFVGGESRRGREQWHVVVGAADAETPWPSEALEAEDAAAVVERGGAPSTTADGANTGGATPPSMQSACTAAVKLLEEVTIKGVEELLPEGKIRAALADTRADHGDCSVLDLFQYTGADGDYGMNDHTDPGSLYMSTYTRVQQLHHTHPAENLLEETDGLRRPLFFFERGDDAAAYRCPSRCDNLLPSTSPDACPSGDVIAFEGLLTILPASCTPALEVFDVESDAWVAVERICGTTSLDAASRDVIIFGGQMLEKLTQGGVRACRHLVAKTSNQRFSTIYELRADSAFMPVVMSNCETATPHPAATVTVSALEVQAAPTHEPEGNVGVHHQTTPP